MSSGDVVMNYKQVPMMPSEVSTDHHPVKVGLSDAFVMQSQLRFLLTSRARDFFHLPIISTHPICHPVVSEFFLPAHKRNTIYEYHRVDLKSIKLTDNSYVYLTALPSKSETSVFGPNMQICSVVNPRRFSFAQLAYS